MLIQRKRELLIEIVIAITITVVASYAFYEIDLVDWWYHFTRDHEDWEMDELLGIVLAILIAGTVLSIRHAFVMHSLMQRLENAQKTILEQTTSKSRQDKMAALGQLAGGLAHEINNALQPAIGLIPFIREGLKKSGNTKHLEYAELIESSTAHARKVVENVLLYAHENKDELERCDARKVFAEAIDFSRQLMPSTLTFETRGLTQDKDKPTFFMECNPTGLTQVIINIFNNAADAMQGQGTIRISLDMEKVANLPRKWNLWKKDHPLYAVLHIHDNGAGMPPEILEKIFDPFFTTKEIQSGTGLGLSVVFGIMKQHNADIFVESEVGKGTTFVLCFPAYES